MGWSVYILKSERIDKYYVGQSADPDRRLMYHNTVEKGFTSRYRPWEIVYRTECETKEQAREIESRIKKWESRIMIEKLIEGKIKV
jgi:putative endonuclease